MKISTVALTAALTVSLVATGGVAHASVAPHRPSTDRITVDLSRQVLDVYSGRHLVFATHVSTGSGHLFRNSSGGEEFAHTPVGRFTIYERVRSWQVSYLGAMYKPMYFDGGYAIHGEASVPDYPASHGCVRVPLNRMDHLFAITHRGEPVIISRT